MKEIFIIRHGQTDFNKQGIIQGRGVNTSLNEHGEWQARQFYRAYRHVPFQKLYTSALNRSIESVKLFIEDGMEWEKRPELDEIDWGHHEGKRASDGMKAEYARITGAWARNDLHVKIPGGESPLDMQARQRVFVEYLKQQPEEKVLICSHGRAMRSLLCTMTDDGLCNMENYPHANLTLYKVIYNGQGFEIALANDTGHLEG